MVEVLLRALQDTLRIRRGVECIRYHGNVRRVHVRLANHGVVSSNGAVLFRARSYRVHPGDICQRRDVQLCLGGCFRTRARPFRLFPNESVINVKAKEMDTCIGGNHSLQGCLFRPTYCFRLYLYATANVGKVKDGIRCTRSAKLERIRRQAISVCVSNDYGFRERSILCDAYGYGRGDNFGVRGLVGLVDFLLMPKGKRSWGCVFTQ